MPGLLTPNTSRVVGWGLAVVALVASSVYFVQFGQGRDPDPFAIVLWLLVPNAIAGFVIAWQWSDMPDPLSSIAGKAYQRYEKKVHRGLLDALVLLLIQFVGVNVIQLVVAITSRHWGEFFVGPMLVIFVAGIPLFLAMLVGLLVVAPLRTLCTALVALLSGGRVDSARPAFALFLVSLIPFAALAVLAGYTVPDATSLRNPLAGFVLLAQLMFTVTGTAEQQVLAWFARLIVVLWILDFAWIWRINRRRRAAQR